MVCAESPVAGHYGLAHEQRAQRDFVLKIFEQGGGALQSSPEEALIHHAGQGCMHAPIGYSGRLAETISGLRRAEKAHRSAMQRAKASVALVMPEGECACITTGGVS